jgi:hypothetical protein
MARSQEKSRGRHAGRALVLAAAVAGVGCGDTDPGGLIPPDCEPAEGAMLPWKTGNTWTYAVNDAGLVSTKETVVGEMEPVMGTGPNKDVMAFKVVTHKGGMDQTVSWQAPSGDNVIRYREQAFSASTGALELEEHWDPHKLHIDGSAARRVTGVSWLEIYQEMKMPVGAPPQMHEARDRWSVLSACASVTVPAGTFTAIHLQKVSANGGSAKTYWYVPGVGKVKESGGQLEELVSYALVP